MENFVRIFHSKYHQQGCRSEKLCLNLQSESALYQQKYNSLILIIIQTNQTNLLCRESKNIHYRRDSGSFV